ncbi:hypothetical protein AAH994_14405 [Weeksellaceae bacterium A-14]
MLKEEFESFWKMNFKEVIPLYFTFRQTYPKRWLRIHSLPESKRYADNKLEMETILNRQNQIISDELKENDDIYLVRDEYFINTGEIENEDEFYTEFNFQKLSILNLSEYYPIDYDDKDKLNVLVSKQKWKKNKYNLLLEDIANDVSQIFIVSIKKKNYFCTL